MYPKLRNDFRTKQQIFDDLFESEQITNEQHFDFELGRNSLFAKACNSIRQIEAKKTQWYQINCTKPMKTYEEILEEGFIGYPPEWPLELRLGVASAIEVFESIARENNIRFKKLLPRIFDILCDRRGKENSIMLLGASDSGKTVVADLLCGMLQPHEIGICKIPGRTSSNQFWKQNLRGKKIYRIEEYYVDDQTIMQEVKTLLEGSENITTEIKYKTALPVPRRPVIVTGNAEHKVQCAGEFSSEADAIYNRAFVLMMKIPLKNRIGKRNIGHICKNRAQVVAALYNRWGRRTKPRNDDPEDEMVLDILNKYY